MKGGEEEKGKERGQRQRERHKGVGGREGETTEDRDR